MHRGWARGSAFLATSAFLPSYSSCATPADAVQRCVQGFSVELTPSRTNSILNFSDIAGLHRGTTVNVTTLVGANMQDSVHACARLHAAGMNCVAHVPAREFRSISELEAFLKEVRATGCDEVLVLGGGAPKPAGELSEAMQVLESGLLQKYGFRKVGVAAHPEGHPDVAEEVMTRVLLEKAKWAKDEGVELYFETQFSFEAEPVLQWERRTRAMLRDQLGPDAVLPRVHLGLAGPARISSLIRFAAFSGVGSSLAFIAKNKSNVLKLTTTSTPDRFIAEIAKHMATEPESLIEGLHFYPFGGFENTVSYARAVEEGNFELIDDGVGFITTITIDT